MKAELSQVVELLGIGTHMREADGIGKQFISLGVALMSWPAVIDDDVLVASGQPPIAHEHVSLSHDQSLTDTVLWISDTVGLATEALPREPSHGWSQGEAVVEAMTQPSPLCE